MNAAKLLGWVLALSFLVFSGPARGEDVSFRGLGDLPGGEYFSQAYDVSSDGLVVVGTSASAGLHREAFRWTDADGMIGLGDFPGGLYGESYAYGVSADGSVVVGESDKTGPSFSTSFIWTQTDGMVEIPGVPPDSLSSVAYGVSADGSAVVGHYHPGTAFRWREDTGLLILPHFPDGGFWCSASAVSSDGSVVVGKGDRFLEDNSIEHEAFRWTEADGLVGLGDLAGGDFFSSATGVSDDGSTVVGYSYVGSGGEAFRWTAENGIVGLGALFDDDFASIALDVSGDGSVVVGYSRVDMGYEAFIWDEGNGMRSLREVLENDYGINLGGWILCEATAISDDGMVIVGQGINANGDEEAWIATIPEPTTIALLATGCVILTRQGRRLRTGRR